MKRERITFCSLAIIILSTVCLWICPKSKPIKSSDFLRLHIRANSNESCDQSVKYLVKDEIVRYLTPLVASEISKKDAIGKLSKRTQEIARIADETLRKNGYFYGAKAEIRKEEFPTRVYGETTLSKGVYDALIIELGSGKGDNWWCVVYPPLCFAGSDIPIEYRSIIVEKIRRWKNGT